MIDAAFVVAIVAVPAVMMARGLYRLVSSDGFRRTDGFSARLSQVWRILWPALVVALVIGGAWIVLDTPRG